MTARGMLIICLVFLAMAFLILLLPEKPPVKTEITIESARANEMYILAFREAIETNSLTVGRFLVKNYFTGEEYLVPVRIFIEAQIKYYKSFMLTGQIKEEYPWAQDYHDNLYELRQLIKGWTEAGLYGETENYFEKIDRVSCTLHNYLVENLCLDIGGNMK